MPEIREVRKYADLIRKKAKNKEIIGLKILNGRYRKHGPFENYNKLKNKLPIKLIDVKTKGKLLYMVFEGDLYLMCTTGLVGGWCYLKNGSDKYQFSDSMRDYSKAFTKEQIQSYINNALNHLNFELKLVDGSLYFFDMLSYGTLKVINGAEEMNKKLSQIGPDIMDANTTYDLFEERITKSVNMNKPIGVVLVNQKIISGMGNYLRSEILYASKINPFRKVKTLDKSELKKIYQNSKVLTWGDYDIAKGKKLGIIKKNTKLPGNYGRMFYVYNEEYDIYGNPVIKKELYEGSQKRFIYYVKQIQK
jgi:formamidopyrimidine-DNA glycosylase